MSIETTFFEKLNELDRISKTASAKRVVEAPTIELYANQIPELDVKTPTYLTQVVLAADENDSIEVLREKKQAKEPEDLVEKAHPKPIYVADGMGDGGLVENQNEMHAKIQQMINKMPTGNLINTWATVLNELTKIASELDAENHPAAAIVDQTIAELCGQEDGIEKEAGLPLVFMVGSLIAGIGAGIYQAIRGKQDGLTADANQLVGTIDGWRSDPKFSAAAPQIDKLYQDAVSLTALANQFGQASSAVAVSNGQNQAEVDAANEIGKEVGALVTSIRSSMAQIKKTFPSEFFTATEGGIEDIQDDLAAINSTLVAGKAQAQAKTQELPPGTKDELEDAQRKLPEQSGEKAEPGAVKPGGADRIGDIQDYLSSIDFKVPRTGVADQATIKALTDYEEHINTSEVKGDEVKTGLGLDNLPGNRLAEMLDDDLTAAKLHALTKLFENPAAHVRF